MSIHESMLQFAHIYGKFEHNVIIQSKPEILTQLQYRLMILISPKSKSPSEISQCLDISLPNTSREIRQLIAMELLTKVQDDKDKRKHYIHLSPLGESMMYESQARIQDILDKTLCQYSKEELEEMAHAFDLLSRKLES